MLTEMVARREAEASALRAVEEKYRRFEDSIAPSEVALVARALVPDILAQTVMQMMDPEATADRAREMSGEVDDNFDMEAFLNDSQEKE